MTVRRPCGAILPRALLLGVALLGVALLGVALLGVALLGVALLGVALLGVALLGVALLGVALLGVALLGVALLGVALLGVALLGVALLGSALRADPPPAQGPMTLLGPALSLRVVTDRDNGKTFTLPPDTTLVVRLRANRTTGYDWNLLVPSHAPLTLSGPPTYTPDKVAPGIVGAGGVGAGGVEEFTFAPHYQPGITQAFYLRLLSLTPFRAGIAGASLFEVHVVLPPQWTPPPPRPRASSDRPKIAPQTPRCNSRAIAGIMSVRRGVEQSGSSSGS